MMARGTVIDPRRLRLRMVRELAARGITDGRVLDAMSRVPRHLFVPEGLRSRAYEDCPLPIGYGQTISQPSTVALMSQMLETSPGMRVLEVGTGSGYQAAVLAAMGCTVYTVERLKELYQSARALLQQLDLRAIHMQRSDGTLGMPAAAPFDRIIVTAGGPQIPRPLLEQLAVDGIMLIPVGARPRLLSYPVKEISCLPVLPVPLRRAALPRATPAVPVAWNRPWPGKTRSLPTAWPTSGTRSLS